MKVTYITKSIITIKSQSIPVIPIIIRVIWSIEVEERPTILFILKSIIAFISQQLNGYIIVTIHV